MNDKNYELEYNQLIQNKIFQQMILWVKTQIDIYASRCARDSDEKEWRKNQGRVNAYETIYSVFLDPSKIMRETTGNKPASQKE